MVKQEFLVTIEMPPNATYTEAAQYIKDAVQVHSSSLNKGAPMFHFRWEEVTCRPIYRREEPNHVRDL